MQKYQLVCTNCKAEYGNDCSRFRCGRCNCVLEVKYDYSSFKLNKNFKKLKITHKKYSCFFPINKMISLGEGGTKLAGATKFGNKPNGFKLYLKVESGNPTKTFKDRGSSIEISKAKELGFKEVCCASTGNMGLSVATYAKDQKIRCTIFISKDANKEKIEKIRKQRAKIVLVNGDFNASLLEAEKFAHKKGIFMCGDYHYRKEGQKSVIFEIIEQLHYKVPDYLFVQVGNSTLLAAIFKGLQEFKKVGLINKFPRIIAVQSEQCDPLVRAYKKGKKVHYVTPRTRADAIAVGYPTFGFEGLKAINATKGYAQSVSDFEIEHSNSVLYNSTRIRAELGGATSFAGFLDLYNKKPGIFKNKIAVVIVTGNNED